MSARSILSILLVSVLGCAGRAAPVVTQPSAAQQTRAHAAQLFRDGSALSAAGDLTRAEQYLATALREGHDPERTMRALLSVCVRASRLRSALVYAAPYLMAHPHDGRLRQLVASIQLALGDLPAAERELKRVVAHDANAAEAQFLLASILQQYPHREMEAAAHFARYVALRPEGVHAEEARASLTTIERGQAQLN
jgi:Flp pilus assembly protein TadD